MISGKCSSAEILQGGNQRDRWRFPHIICVWLEGETEDPDRLSSQRPTESTGCRPAMIVSENASPALVA